MWHPEFAFVRSAPALLRGYHRSFCVYSTRFRGTPAQPGLVLGLDLGGSCRGIAFLVGAPQVETTLATLWAREMSRLVYEPRHVTLEIGEERVKALTFVADRGHPSYAGRLAVKDVAETLVECCGERGPNADYLFNTLRHLDELGIREAHLSDVRAAVQALQRPRTQGIGARASKPKDRRLRRET
jgi:cation transport protein ChaC